MRKNTKSREWVILSNYSYKIVCARTEITQANPNYILVLKWSQPINECHVEYRHTAKIWRVVPLNILVTVARDVQMTRHGSFM